MAWTAAADIDALAASLRERLLSESARDRPEDVEGRIWAPVEREAALRDTGAREALVARVVERSFGLEPLLRDPRVDEVMVNGVGPVWVERAGRLECSDVRFASVADLRDAIQRILAPLGRRVDEAEPLADARLPDCWQLSVAEAMSVPPEQPAGPPRPGRSQLVHRPIRFDRRSTAVGEVRRRAAVGLCMSCSFG